MKGFLETLRALKHLGDHPVYGDLYSLAIKARPFVFFDEANDIAPSHIGDPIEPSNSDYKIQEKTDLDLPFNIISIEFASPGQHPDSMITFRFRNVEQNKGLFVYCMIVIELSPQKNIIILLFDDNERPGVEVLSPGSLAHRKLQGLVSMFINKISKCSVATETVGVSLKYKQGGQNKFHKIKKIIHIIPNKIVKNNKEAFANFVFSHRFEVMGHWRKIDTIGKDRNGNYNVSGFTWVSAHEKGPEHLPLIKKARVIHGTKDQTHPGS